MKNTIVAAIGSDMSSLYSAVREFPTERVILLSQKDDDAEPTKETLEKFKVPTRVVNLKDKSWESIFKAVKDIKNFEPDVNKILIDVATGCTTMVSAMTSAAFVNGIRAFSIEGDNIIMLPILKFSYFKMVPEKKMEILKLLYKKKQCCSSLEDLSKEMNMSVPLISYHVNGNMQSQGLKQLGLIDTTEKKGKIKVELSLQGKLIVQGQL